MKYKLVIFDFDGTLADSFPFFLTSINTLAAIYKFPAINSDEVDLMRGMDARQLMKNARLPAWKLPLIVRAFIRLMAKNVEQIQLFNGIPDLLKQLSDQDIQLAIVSSNSEDNIRQILGPQTAALITYYGCGTSIFGKQHKFRKAITRSRVRPEQVLCVGDELRDHEAAKEASLAFGAVAWGYTRVDVFEAQPDIDLFYTVADLSRIIA